MNLEAMTLEVRPRTPWEAMDVAVRLAVTHWRILLSAWLVTVLPVFLIINLILLQEHPYWAFFLLWFLKPLYDRVPLFVLSRVIFAEATHWKDVLNAIPSFFKTSILSSLTLYRLDPGRAFVLPVIQLEGLKGKRRRERMNTLRRSGNNREVLFFVLCFHLESLISWGLIGLLLMLLPTELAVQGAEDVFLNEAPGLLLNALSMSLYFLVMMIVETLYVAGGFVLYLNRRIILEGWDIELVFRRLARRFAGSAAELKSVLSVFILGLLLMTPLLLPQAVQAMPQNTSARYEKILPPLNPQRLEPQASSEIIRQVMTEPVFQREKKVQELKYTGTVNDRKSGSDTSRSGLTAIFETIGKFLALLFESALWILALIVIILLIKYRERWQFGWRGFFRRKAAPEKMPEMLFGLDLREQSLPDDVAAQAMLFYQQQDYRAALALLYRGSLAWLIRHYDFSLPRGATEGDCLALVSKALQSTSPDALRYFRDLTHAWQLTAYAHRAVPAEQMEYLCNNWSLHYKPDAGD